MNALKGDTYYSTDENSDYKKFPDGTVTYTESLEETVIDEENATKDLAGNIIPDENGIIPTKNIWKEYSYTKNYSGIYAQTASQTWQLTIYGKYTFRFGPTHTPKAKPAREKKARVF